MTSLSKSTTSIASHMVGDDLEALPVLMKKQHLTNQIVSSGVKRRKRRKRKIELSEDIIHNEILTRLPTKYLVQFRLVCKSWKSLFSSSVFVQSHLTRQHSYMIGQVKKPDDGLMIISPSCEIKLTAEPLLSDILLGSINGLVCMASGKDFCLWNPAMGQLKEIYRPSQRQRIEEFEPFRGFSWDHVHNDYKVVIMCHPWINSSWQLTIYSFNSASWTELVIPDYVLPAGRKIIGPINGNSSIKTPSTIVKGLPYWSCYCLSFHGKQHKYISTFKFVAETNKIRLLPNLDSVTIGKKEFNLVNIKDCLYGMAYEKGCEDSLVDIYSLDDESQSGVWSKMYTVGPINLCLTSWLLSQCFKSGGEILIVKNHLLSVYDPKTRETKFIKSTPCVWKSCFSYTPSLVCVQGMESMQVPENGGAFNSISVI